MTELLDDDMILNSVTYFKYPSSTNDNDGGEFELSRVKQEPEISENQQDSLNTYDNQQNNYQPTDNYPYVYSSYFPNQSHCNYNEQSVPYSQYNNYPFKQEVKSEPYEFCNKEQNCYTSSMSFLNAQYEYQQQQHQHQQQEQQHHQPQPQQQQQPHQQQQQYQQNGAYWNGWSHAYPEQPCCSPQGSSSPATFPDIMSPQPFIDNIGAKKRGRKKKIKAESEEVAVCTANFPLEMMQMGNETERSDTPKPIIKERRKHDRFNGMPEEEVSKRTLPDLLATNLDIIIIGINPGLFAAYKGHHYAGPGNHFWKCLYLSGLISEQLTADDDYKLIQYGIGFTNMVERATKGSSDLTRKEIREGGLILLEKLQKFKPKIAVFNGKLIFEVFSGKKEFNFGRQPDFVDGTNTYMWVMPSSSARCAQLPRASDKVPYYTALKKFRDYLNGAVSILDENDIVFQYCKLKTFPRNTAPKVVEVKIEEKQVEDDTDSPTRLKEDKRKKLNDGTKYETSPVGDEMIVKKKRGRPKKVRLVEENSTGSPSMQSTVPQPPNAKTMFSKNNANSNASSKPTTPITTSKYFAGENHSPGYGHSNNYSPSYQHQFSSPTDAGYYSQNSLESTYNTYDFHPSEIQSHLRSFLPSSKLESACSLNE